MLIKSVVPVKGRWERDAGITEAIEYFDKKATAFEATGRDIVKHRDELLASLNAKDISFIVREIDRCRSDFRRRRR